MESILNLLSQRVAAAIAAAGFSSDAMVRPSQDERFGDYQSNAAMGIARAAKQKPRDVAEAIRSHLDVADLCERVEIAGPGFINFHIQPEFLGRRLALVPPVANGDDDRLGIDPDPVAQTVVVDLSSPNLAKEMHVGHLRSTVIGDCIARVLEFAGHRVYRENHVGDWGTQFGMLVAHLRREKPNIADHPGELVIADLESFYVAAKARFDADEKFKTESRETVVALQQGDAVTRRLWKAFCDESLRHCHAIYDRLGVRLEDRGESFYAERMEEIVRRLGAMREEGDAGAVRVSDGALCVFMDGFTTRGGDPLPLIVRKRDGGFNYATSDLATIVHRVEELGASRILYVVGLPQKQHFDMLFAAARRVGWVDDSVDLEHVGFGSMLASTGQPFRTREGGTVKLKDLLDEAVARARAVIASAERDESAADAPLSSNEADRVAETVGLAAIKYFDLAHARQSDYKFDLGAMVSMEGNTAPYMLYAYARIRSIARKAGVDLAALPTSDPIELEHPAEIALAKKILQFADVPAIVASDLRPNVLTDYLYDLAKTFSRFYDKKVGVRVIDAAPESVRRSRLRLCDLTARTLKLGLHLLGIDTVEKM